MQRAMRIPEKSLPVSGVNKLRRDRFFLRSRVAFHQTAPPDSLAGREQSLTEVRSRAVVQAGRRDFYSFNFNCL
jgi:hypothetical protein